MDYYFNAKKVKDDCVQWIRDYFKENGPMCNAVIGISGGKDSSVVAALCVEALGKDRGPRCKQMGQLVRAQQSACAAVRRARRPRLVLLWDAAQLPAARKGIRISHDRREGGEHLGAQPLQEFLCGAYPLRPRHDGCDRPFDLPAHKEGLQMVFRLSFYP